MKKRISKSRHERMPKHGRKLNAYVIIIAVLVFSFALVWFVNVTDIKITAMATDTGTGAPATPATSTPGAQAFITGSQPSSPYDDVFQVPPVVDENCGQPCWVSERTREIGAFDISGVCISLRKYIEEMRCCGDQDCPAGESCQNGKCPSGIGAPSGGTGGTAQDFEPANRGPGDINAVVIHYCAGNYASCKAELMNPGGRRVSAHYIVNRDGSYEQLVDPKNIAWHATYYNSRSIGIEVAGSGAESDWTDAVYNTLATIIKTASGAYGIPKVHPTDSIHTNGGKHIDVAGIVGHSQIQLNKQDPGPNFNWNKLMSLVNS